MSIVFHIDVNSAFLSWSAVEKIKRGSNIDLRTIPSIIGGDKKSRRGIVLAKSVPAKKFGIQTGEPVVNAFRKCPNLVMESPNHELYSDYSKRLMGYIRTVSPIIEQVSVDECYMDYDERIRGFSSYLECADTIRKEIYDKFGFTVNIGISNNKLLAKMASDFEKPDKTHTLFPEEIEEKMWCLPLRDLYMAGKSSVATFEKLEIKTIGDLAKSDPKLIELHLKSHGRKLWEYANGIANDVIRSERSDAKGIGNSTTLPRDVVTREEAKKVIKDLASSVGRRLRKAGKKASSISVEIKYHDFASSSHQKQIAGFTNDDKDIYKEALDLFDELWDKEPIRLLGIRTTKLTSEEEPEQLSLFDIKDDMVLYNKKAAKTKKVDEALLKIKEKYGENIVTRGEKHEKN
ncbi:MAG: DNA polymerase IV [Suipraeoptans sp.]